MEVALKFFMEVTLSFPVKSRILVLDGNRLETYLGLALVEAGTLHIFVSGFGHEVRLCCSDLIIGLHSYSFAVLPLGDLSDRT